MTWSEYLDYSAFVEKQSNDDQKCDNDIVSKGDTKVGVGPIDGMAVIHVGRG